MGSTVPEYCLLGLHWWPTCMQKGEWASWVQAGGALLALWITVRLAAANVNDRRETARRAAVLYAHRLNLAVGEMHDACERQLTADYFERRAAVVMDVVSFGEGITVADVDASRLDAFLRLRGLGAEARWASTFVASHAFGFEHWQAEFAALSERAGLLLLEVGKQAALGEAPRRRIARLLGRRSN